MDYRALAYLTQELPGCGGEIKHSPQDFEVEEIPSYQPSGEGSHLFLWIQKTDFSAEDLEKHVSRTLAIPRSSIGMAGMKDRYAVTRQYVSVPADHAERIEDLNHESVQVLHHKLHGHKLRTGHLQGNKFRVVIREVNRDGVARARAVAETLEKSGFPNYYGDQRFGYRDETLKTGFRLLRKEMTPQDLPRPRRKFLLRLALNAVQSHLFNQLLSERISSNTLLEARVGDVMQRLHSGGSFICQDPSVDQDRINLGELSIAGPMFGPKLLAAEGEAGREEEQILVGEGIELASFSEFKRLTSGARRPYVARPSHLALEAIDSGLRLTFDLPKGSYATVLLREFMKSE